MIESDRFKIKSTSVKLNIYSLHGELGVYLVQFNSTNTTQGGIFVDLEREWIMTGRWKDGKMNKKDGKMNTKDGKINKKDGKMNEKDG